jgi:hypothetical protein
MVPPPSPYGSKPVWELTGYLQAHGYDQTWHVFIRAAVATSPLGVHDIAVTNVTTSKDGCRPRPTVPVNSTAKVNVTVANIGDFDENLINVTVYANTTKVASTIIATLNNGTEITLSFIWNTTGYAIGNYTIWAYAQPVTGEDNILDNTFVGGVVKVAIVGDINGDGQVNILDAILLGNAFDTAPGEPAWSPNADLNVDDTINILDAIIFGNHFDEREP